MPSTAQKQGEKTIRRIPDIKLKATLSFFLHSIESHAFILPATGDHFMKTATFNAILDVKSGRDALCRRIESGERVRARVDLVLDTVHSRDDGTSIEFSGAVQAVKEFMAARRLAKRKARRA
jgi:hypothetical protein